MNNKANLEAGKFSRHFLGIIPCFQTVFMAFAGEETVGFLARMQCFNCPSPESGPLVFTHTAYNYGGHCNTSNGKFTAPVTGLYLINVQLTGLENRADFYLMVGQGTGIATIRAADSQDPDKHVMGYANMVYKLRAGQQIYINPIFVGDRMFFGSYGAQWRMSSWFCVHLLKTLT